MKESFEFSTTLKNFLFKGLNVDTDGGVVALCVVISVLVILLEVCKTLMVYLVYKKNVCPMQQVLRDIAENSTDDSDTDRNSPDAIIAPLRIPVSPEILQRERYCYHILCSLIYILHAVIGYVLMLAVMSYNAWVFITVTSMSGLGYYLFETVRHRLKLFFLPLIQVGSEDTQINNL